MSHWLAFAHVQQPSIKCVSCGGGNGAPAWSPTLLLETELLPEFQAATREHESALCAPKNPFPATATQARPAGQFTIMGLSSDLNSASRSRGALAAAQQELRAGRPELERPGPSPLSSCHSHTPQGKTSSAANGRPQGSRALCLYKNGELQEAWRQWRKVAWCVLWKRSPVQPAENFLPRLVGCRRLQLRMQPTENFR